MRFLRLLMVVICLQIPTISGCGGGGGGGGGGGSAPATPITASINTVITSPTAVGTVSISGVSTPIVYGLLLTVTYPSGANIVSAVQSGVAIVASTPVVGTPELTQVTISLPSTVGFGAGEVMQFNFNNVPSGTFPLQFTISSLSVYGVGGVQIQ